MYKKKIINYAMKLELSAFRHGVGVLVLRRAHILV